MKTYIEYLADYTAWLYNEEKKEATVEKYTHAVRGFLAYIGEAELTKAKVLEYRALMEKCHKPASVNAKLAGINGFLKYIERYDCIVKTLKVQKQMFANEEEVLTVEEYQRLLDVSEGTQIHYIMHTICETGIRVSELPYITVESLYRGKALVCCKNKRRYVMLAEETCELLKYYCKVNHIKSGSIFVTRTGKPIHRSSIWKKMQELCEAAGVDKQKVHPHNLRHLFARVFYQTSKDVVRLAEILGHSSIQTTQIYTRDIGIGHKKMLGQVCRELAAR